MRSATYREKRMHSTCMWLGVESYIKLSFASWQLHFLCDSGRSSVVMGGGQASSVGGSAGFFSL